MVKIDSDSTYGFTIDNFNTGYRLYQLPSSENILIGNDGRLEVDLAVADNNTTEDHDAFFGTLTFAQSIGLEIIVAGDSSFGKGLTGAEKDLLQRLEPYQGLIRPGFETFFEGEYTETEFIKLIARCSQTEGIDAFLERVLRVVLRKAEGSTADGTTPNYRIQVPKLVESIGTYIHRQIHLQGLPEAISGFTRYRNEDRIGELLGHGGYVSAIVQTNGSSFTYDDQIAEEVRKLTGGMGDDVEKSRAIFDWVIANIVHGKQKRKHGVGYRGALEVYRDREGVCGESASLQVTMERLAGNIAFLAEVEDFLPQKHACAAHIRPSGQVILIDTTAPLVGYDVQYKKFRILSDEHSLASYC